jgi:NAD-dependent deacetylase
MNIFVLTGAGVSAESGLGTFRDKAGSGIWAKFDPMKLATPEAFAAHPEKVHAFYNKRRRDLLQAEANPPLCPGRTRDHPLGTGRPPVPVHSKHR